ncbi:MAG: hypothetical protein L3J03_00370 [Desulfobacterales bacterium]|nr:hypothetical protein [Desulfobacterales bacterium]
MRSVIASIIAGFLLLTGLLLLPPAGVSATAGTDLTILYGNDVLGELEPCG